MPGVSAVFRWAMLENGCHCHSQTARERIGFWDDGEAETMTTYSSSQKQLVCDWNEKWHEQSKLLLDEIFSTKRVEWSLQPRTEIDELHYLKLRFWFIDNEAEFLPIWRICVSCGALELMQSHYQGLTLEDYTIMQQADNPFSCYYEPDNLYLFANYLGVQIGVPSWEPCNKDASRRLYFISTLGSALCACNEWIMGL
jgi:hypothetical protein